MKNNLYIDGTDAFTRFGVFIAEGGHNEVVAFPALKAPEVSNDWAEYDGIEVDLSDPKLDTKELEIKSRDSAGYVTELLADGKVLEGESFRMGMGLSSANFTIQTIGNKVRFLCKGKGHGLGFSQYGGNEMAKNSKTEEEILEYYFPEMEIVEIDAVMSK